MSSSVPRELVRNNLLQSINEVSLQECSQLFSFIMLSSETKLLQLRTHPNMDKMLLKLIV